jgi:effector-binding domain-containing protein
MIEINYEEQAFIYFYFIIKNQNPFIMETIVKNEIKEMTWPEKLFITKRDRVSFDKLSSFFGDAYGALYSTIQKLGLTAQGMPCALYYEVDEFKKETDVAAAVAVTGPVPELKEFNKIILPKSKVLTTTHYGSYENMGPAYEELEKYRKGHALKKELVIEEYFSDPAIEKDPSKWKTNIYFVVK